MLMMIIIMMMMWWYLLYLHARGPQLINHREGCHADDEIHRQFGNFCSCWPPKMDMATTMEAQFGLYLLPALWNIVWRAFGLLTDGEFLSIKIWQPAWLGSSTWSWTQGLKCGKFLTAHGSRIEAPKAPSYERRRRWGGGVPLSIRLGGLGERRELPQWGLGRSHSRFRFWCILLLISGIWWQRY